MSRIGDESVIWRRSPNGRLEKVTIMARHLPPTTEQLLETIADLAQKLADQEARFKELQIKVDKKEDEDWYDSDKETKTKATKG